MQYWPRVNAPRHMNPEELGNVTGRALREDRHGQGIDAIKSLTQLVEHGVLPLSNGSSRGETCSTTPAQIRPIELPQRYTGAGKIIRYALNIDAAIEDLERLGAGPDSECVAQATAKVTEFLDPAIDCLGNSSGAQLTKVVEHLIITLERTREMEERLRREQQAFGKEYSREITSSTQRLESVSEQLEKLRERLTLVKRQIASSKRKMTEGMVGQVVALECVAQRMAEYDAGRRRARFKQGAALVSVLVLGVALIWGYYMRL